VKVGVSFYARSHIYDIAVSCNSFRSPVRFLLVFNIYLRTSMLTFGSNCCKFIKLAHSWHLLGGGCFFRLHHSLSFFLLQNHGWDTCCCCCCWWWNCRQKAATIAATTTTLMDKIPRTLGSNTPLSKCCMFRKYRCVAVAKTTIPMTPTKYPSRLFLLAVSHFSNPKLAPTNASPVLIHAK